MTDKRTSGVLLHISSLPSKYGIGDFGPHAYEFAVWLAKARQSFWQILPLNPPALRGNAFSPYDSTSAYAGNYMFISPEMLRQQGLLTTKDLQDRPAFPQGRVDYAKISAYKTALLDAAYGRFKKNSRRNTAYLRFCREQKYWLDDYVLFTALRQRFWPRLWCDWPAGLRDREKQALRAAAPELGDKIDREKFVQFIFFSQWYALKKYCNYRRIKIIGDVPIYVAYDSADVWSNPQIFKLAKTKKPTSVAGVPPDLYSRTGQLWGNPVYDWNELRSQKYKWWIDRIRHNLTLCDTLRLDHFRGFAAYWQVSAGQNTAQNGRWVKGPGAYFLETLLKRFPAKSFIAEDLGYITPDVRALITRFDLACMKVLLFGFGKDTCANIHCPHNFIKNSVVYTGTHDNNTVKGWFMNEADAVQKKRLFDYIGHKTSTAEVHWEFIRMTMGCVSDTAIVAMQDILGLGQGARMNRPATVNGNWAWRLTREQLTTSLAEKLTNISKVFGRV